MPAREDLARTLGVPQERLASLEPYADDQVAQLDALITGAMKREDHAFVKGLEDALRFVPALLRPAAKKILAGGGR